MEPEQRLQTAEARSKSAEEAASERLAQAEAAEKALKVKISEAEGADTRAAEAKSAAEKAERARDAAEQRALDAGVEYDVLAIEKVSLKGELPALRAQCASLAAEKQSLAADVAELRLQRTSFQEEKTTLAGERESFEADRKKFVQSRELIRELRDGKWRAEVSDQAVRFEPVQRMPGQFVQVFQKWEVEEWLPAEVIAHNDLLTSRDHVKELANELQERREELIRAMPKREREREEYLREEQRKETKLINTAIAQTFVRRDAMNM